MMSFEECQEWSRKRREEKAALEAKCREIGRQERIQRGLSPERPQVPKEKWDHPCMPDDGFVTFLYVLGMIVCLMFNQWYIGWFALTVWYGMFISRHNND